MEIQKIKVCDKIRIFEITDKFYPKLTGFQSAEVRDCFFGNKYGVNLYVSEYGLKYFHFGIDEIKQAKLIGQLVIKSIKI